MDLLGSLYDPSHLLRCSLQPHRLNTIIYGKWVQQSIQLCHCIPLTYFGGPWTSAGFQATFTTVFLDSVSSFSLDVQMLAFDKGVTLMHDCERVSPFISIGRLCVEFRNHQWKDAPQRLRLIDLLSTHHHLSKHYARFPSSTKIPSPKTK